MHRQTLSETDADASADLLLELTATTDDLIQALTTIDQYAVRRNLGRDALIRLRILVEELFTNTIKYGYGGECSRPVRMRLTIGPPLVLTYEDAAAPFDPVAWHGQWAATPCDDDMAGQRGIPLILGLATGSRYQALNHGNRLSLTIT